MLKKKWKIIKRRVKKRTLINQIIKKINDFRYTNKLKYILILKT